MPGGGRGGRGGRGGGGRGGGHFNNHHSGGTKPAVTTSDGDKNGGADGATPPALDAGSAVDETEKEHNKAAQQANNDAGDTAVASENGEQVLILSN